ncbi:alkene reductase [Waterburya agarophytonicola K14]|uniref:Alkene reductase n=1 Tax=Waterburya agarophytonicola KI4 TaxID=2874699 RepID=A0A964BSA0_9CYAN|nr:alkene reductase [Waterburya agarophytonicola]MCC0177287.1 alkene reductase [Waterburya agarophytonicola KI4]
MTQVPHLLSSLDKGLSLKNRVVLAPMTRARAGAERIPNALMAEYYAQRANAGLIVTEGTTISPQANGWVHSPGIYTDEQAEAWKQVISAVHEQGAKIFLQLWHTGRASHSSFQENNQLPVAPSAIKIEGSEAHTSNGKQPYETPRALETAEIPQVVEDYRKAAERAKQAGFDGVEIHGANGYLIDEFLQSKTNKRTDKYGGSLENRYRFLKEIVEAILTVWDAKAVGVRLSPNGSFNDMGSTDYRETFTYVAEQLNSYQLGYLHLLDGLAFGFHELGEPMTLAEIKKVYDGILIGNCGYDRNDAEKAIAQGDAELIAFGRAYISTPDLVARFANDWELNPDADMNVWYSFDAEGYTDFPTYQQ